MSMTSGAASSTTVVDIAQEEILTGEAVALDVQPLGFFLRGVGVLIDIAIYVALYAAIMLAMTWLISAGALSPALTPIIAIAGIVTIAVIVPTAVETLSRGRSLGKLAVGGRIVRSDGGAASFRAAFIRAVVGVFEIWMTLGAMAAIVGAFTPRAQRLGDLLAGTYSERTRTPPLPDTDLDVPDHLQEWARTADVARLPDAISRRCTQFLRARGTLETSARNRAAAMLAHQSAPYVSPQPIADAESCVVAIVAVRRQREIMALQRQDALMRRLSHVR